MKIKYILLLIFTANLFACKKFIQVDPPINQIGSSAVYTSDATATSVIRGIYSQMSTDGFASGNQNSFELNSALSSDELVDNQAGVLPFYTNSLTVNNFANNLWSDPYKFINNANALIEGLNNSSGVTSSTKKELTGEAEFVRAFCNFYLVNEFGNVPLILTTNYQQNAVASRTSTAIVYSQIVSDLKAAQNSLSSDFSFSNGERDQPNLGAATALLARVYLYMGDWKDAETEASLVINNTGTYKLASDLDSVFLANSSEAIWQLQPTTPPINTNEASLLIINSSNVNYSLNMDLYNAFENGDNRKVKWIGSYFDGTNTYYFPYKYKVLTSQPLTEYSMVMRLAEQYLIRAEAEANGAGNGLTAAVSDLNIIRNRAGLPNYSGSLSKTSLLTAILHERQVELFTEWGHRWLDLKRTGNVDAVMTIVTPQKGGTWKSYQQLYPIPLSDIQNDKNLQQNPGY